MASPSCSTRERRGRALAAVLALGTLALVVWAVLWARRGGDAHAPLPVPTLNVGLNPELGPEHPLETPMLERDAVERALVAQPDTRGGPYLVGRLLDEHGRALLGTEARVEVRGPAGKRLAMGVDGEGGFGPLLLAAGAWEVTASAPRRSVASAAFELAPGESPAVLEFVLPLAPALEVRLVAVGPGSDGDPEQDLAQIEALLSLHLSLAGEPVVVRRVLGPRAYVEGRAQRLPVVFEMPTCGASTLELRLGGERVSLREVGADEREVVLEVDPLELRRGLVPLVIELRDPAGAPLSEWLQAMLVWEGGVHLVAGQPGPDATQATFAECPIGPARLEVVDADGRRAEVDLVVPGVRPLLLEVSLELVEPPRR